MIFLPDESKRTILPRGIEIIRLENTPSSLYECSLRGLYQDRKYYEAICMNLSIDSLPQRIYRSIQHGPICNCGNNQCNIPIFSDCHFVLMKK